MAYNCGCIKNYFDVHVEFLDCKHLKVQDQSEWMQDEAYNTPKEYDATFTIKTWRATKSVTIPTNGFKVYKAQDFGLECFGDDILCIEANSCGVKYTIQKALLCQSECKVQELLASAKNTEDYDVANKFASIIESIKANVALNRTDVASDLLETLKKQLKRYDCNAHCGCK
jgi:hypothetical protein